MQWRRPNAGTSAVIGTTDNLDSGNHSDPKVNLTLTHLDLESPRADELERRLIAAYAQVRIGDPLDADTLMGPLIDSGAVARYSAAISAACQAPRNAAVSVTAWSEENTPIKASGVSLAILPTAHAIAGNVLRASGSAST